VFRTYCSFVAMTYYLSLALSILLLVVSCSDDKTFGQPPNMERNALTVSRALEPTSMNRTVTVRGTIARVCQEEGCWVVITDGKASVRISFAAEAFSVPLTANGTVVVEGVVTEELMDMETSRAVLSSLGASEAEVAAVQGDRRVPMMVATGIQFTD